MARSAPRRRAGRASRIVLDPCLTELAYRCADGCPRGATCCVGLAVEVSRREVRAVDDLMDEVARLVPSLREADGYASVFVDDPPGLLIEARDDGSCPFLYRTREKALCSIHSVALQTGRDVAACKPAACRHWPLVLEPDGGRLRVTVEAAARRIGCVAPASELPGRPLVLDAFRAEIAELAGEDALAAARAAPSRRGRRRKRIESRGRCG